jgi:hypothetical protein
VTTLAERINAKKNDKGRALTPEQEIRVVEQYANDPGASLRSLGKEYGVSHSAIRRAIERALLLVGLLTACGGAEDTPPLVLSPSDDAMELTSDWARRWSSASGIPITVAEGGTPVLLTDDVWVTEHDAFDHEVPGSVQVCGVTRTRRSGRVELIMVDRTPTDRCRGGWGYTLGHEIGHALAYDGANQHSDEGTLMGETLKHGVTYVIDEPSLGVICTYAECTAFNPEN